MSSVFISSSLFKHRMRIYSRFSTCNERYDMIVSDEIKLPAAKRSVTLHITYDKHTHPNRVDAFNSLSSSCHPSKVHKVLILSSQSPP